MWKENYRQCQKVLLLLVFKPESAHKNKKSYARRGEVKGLLVADAKYMSEDFSFRTMQCLRSARKLPIFKKNTMSYKQGGCLSSSVLQGEEGWESREEVYKTLSYAKLSLND